MAKTPEAESRPPDHAFSEDTKTLMTAMYLAVWEFTAGTTSQMAERLVASRWAHFRTGSRIHIVMSEGLAFWASYLARLYITRDRYMTACREFTEFLAASDGERADNVAERMIGQYGHEDRIRLDIESFYVATKLLLERIAVTFGFFFKRPIPTKGSAHTALGKHFEKWSSQITEGQKTPSKLYGLMKQLSTRVVSFRNIHIEHPSHPTIGVRQWTSTQTLADGTSYIAASAVSGASDTLQSFVTQQTENPADIIALVEEYLGEMLTYFDTYRHASIFAPKKGDDLIVK